MIRVWIALLASLLAAGGAERKFDFGQTNVTELWRGFRSAVTGLGQPGDWKIVQDEVPSAMPSLSDRSPALTRRAVLAQLSRDATDEHFPVLIFEGDTYGDFTFTTRLKTVEGQAEQMAGLAFRIQNETNYYVARVSSLGNNLRFYKFVNGLRSAPIGPDLAVPRGTWHELTVKCEGSRITILLNGKEAMPPLNDTTFAKGKVGFWTKSDSVSYFAEARLSYTPLERLVDVLTRNTLKKYAKLHNLKVYAVPPGQGGAQVVASGQGTEVGEAAGREVTECLTEGKAFIGKTRTTISVLLPLRDRNGDIVAAVKVVMDTFLGQTEKNALERARPVVKHMENDLIASHQPLL
jgi:hypothetical protein